MASEPAFPPEDRIQSLANILSLVAIVGGMDKAAVQRVLITLGSNLINVPGPMHISAELASQLLTQIAHEQGDQAVFRIASDMNFVAQAWKPVLDEYLTDDPHRVLPYAEIVFALFNYSGMTLHDYGAFDRFGGPDFVLPMAQLTAALKTYPVPHTGLVWEMVGFQDPPDQAMVASEAGTLFLFKAASSSIDLRFSELERDSVESSRREHDVRLDAPLFAAFVSGLLGDMLYWAARLRANAVTGQQVWRRLKALLFPSVEAMPGVAPAPVPGAAAGPAPDSPASPETGNSPSTP